ncbi:MAG: hypothetical protein LC745_01160 [Planctomycetia bacterium]|nr:hypothetical protein [Planctomycetia bacterium]
MPEESKPPNFAAMFQGLKATSFSAERLDTPEEEAHKRKKDFISFLVKEIAALVMALLFIAIISTYCCYVVAAHGVTSPEAKQVLPLLTALFGGVVGMAFGKAAK